MRINVDNKNKTMYGYYTTFATAKRYKICIFNKLRLHVRLIPAHSLCRKLHTMK